VVASNIFSGCGRRRLLALGFGRGTLPALVQCAAIIVHSGTAAVSWLQSPGPGPSWPVRSMMMPRSSTRVIRVGTRLVSTGNMPRPWGRARGPGAGPTGKLVLRARGPCAHPPAGGLGPPGPFRLYAAWPGPGHERHAPHGPFEAKSGTRARPTPGQSGPELPGTGRGNRPPTGAGRPAEGVCPLVGCQDFPVSDSLRLPPEGPKDHG
jgi:hypothetical protein